MTSFMNNAWISNFFFISAMFRSLLDLWPIPHCPGLNLKTEVSLRKCIKCFAFTLRRRNLKTITGHCFCFFCWFVFEENSVREITWLSKRHHCQKAPFSKRFSVHIKSKSPKFKIPPVFKQLRFSERLASVDDRLNRRSKAAFTNFFHVAKLIHFFFFWSSPWRSEKNLICLAGYFDFTS